MVSSYLARNGDMECYKRSYRAVRHGHWAQALPEGWDVFKPRSARPQFTSAKLLLTVTGSV